MSNQPVGVTPESPWLGLRSFNEEARGYFFGRDAELDDLYERVVHRPLTIFFGQSGLGKTSLLHAGLVPRLRETGHVPILLRLDWSSTDAAPETQVLSALREALRASKDARWRALADFRSDLPLWQLFHDRSCGFVSSSTERGLPPLVFLFDQFEEIFTLGQRRRDWVDNWRDTLAALVENRPPASLRARLTEDTGLVDRLDLRARPAKFVITLRHDFLHLIERWRRAMPSLFDNRFELKHLNGPQALQAVLYPGRLRANKPPIVDEETGRAIVRFVAGAPEHKPLKEIDAVPPLLSLVCAELNSERQRIGLDRIIFDPLVTEPAAVRIYLESLPRNADGQRDPVARVHVERALAEKGLTAAEVAESLARLVAKGLVLFSTDSVTERMHVTPGFLELAGRTGSAILQVFYDTCFVELHGGVRPWLEETFLSPEGFRQTVNSDTALGSLARLDIPTEVATSTLDTLVDRRILTVEEHGEVRRFELTHDILAPIVRDSRDARRAREAEEAAKRSAREVEEAAKAQELYALSTRGFRPQGLSDVGPRAVDWRTLVPERAATGKGIRLSEYFWDDLLTYIEEGTVIPVVGRELVTVPIDGRDVPLDRYLAQALASRLGAVPHEPIERFSFNDLIFSLVENGDSPDRLYREVWSGLRGLSVTPSSSLIKLAEISPFRLFVSLTFDSLMADAIRSVRREPAPIEIVYTPNDCKDLPADHELRAGDTAVFYLFGRTSPVPDYVLSDEDMLEFFYSLQTGGRRPSRLFDELRTNHLLLLGCALPDWLARFFIRMMQGRRLSSSDHKVLVVDSEADRGFEQFTKYFSPNTQFVPGVPAQFVDELLARWQAKEPAVGRVPSSPSPSMPRGSVYVSYSRENAQAADHIRRALQDVGVTAWSPDDSLIAGDMLDERIRRDIADCAFFMPIVSQATEGQADGYFRLEWKWAAERALGMPEGSPFLLPVLLDDTRLDRADVPEMFRRVQSTHMPGGAFPPDAAYRIRQLVRDHRRRQRSGE